MPLRLSPAMAALIVGFVGLDAVTAKFALDSLSEPSREVIGTASEWHPPALDHAAAPPAKSANAYTETLSRPIFAKNRRPPVVAKPASGPIRPHEAVLPPVNFTVAGVTITPQIRKAFILGGSDPGGVWVDVGAQIAGWTVADIAAAGLTLRNGDRTVQVLLYPDGSTSAAEAGVRPRNREPE